jgi:hypothetical protein
MRRRLVSSTLVTASPKTAFALAGEAASQKLTDAVPDQKVLERLYGKYVTPRGIVLKAHDLGLEVNSSNFHTGYRVFSLDIATYRRRGFRHDTLVSFYRTLHGQPITGKLDLKRAVRGAREEHLLDITTERWVDKSRLLFAGGT